MGVRVMLMRPKNALDVVPGLVLDDRQSAAIERALRDRSIRIRNIDAASRRIVDDYPDLAGWYCLSVRQRGEFLVEKELQSADIMACVPRRMGEEKVHRGRRLPAPVLPVIPGYILVHCVPSAAAFMGLRHIERVTGIVGKGEIPYRLPARMISHFIAMAKAGEYDHREVKVSYLPGEAVVVTDGPFASFPAVVVAIDQEAGHSRINVEVNIFGRPTPVELDVAQIGKL